MNKAAERWRKWAHIGKGKGGGGVWCLGQRDGGVGREKRGKEKHTHTYTLAKNEQKNEPLLLHPPAVKWQFQFCQQTSPATMLPEEAAEGEYTHRLFQTQGMQGLKTTEKSCHGLRLDTRGSSCFKRKRNKSSECSTLSYWVSVSAVINLWTTVWHLLPIKVNQMSKLFRRSSASGQDEN